MNWDEMTSDEKRSYCRTLADENLIPEPHHLRWVIGELWSAEQANARLRAALAVVLDQVDYTASNCGLTDPVSAVLPKEVIILAREALAGAP